MSKCLDALLERRRSVRQYTDEALSRETLESLIAAAIQAPSASNRQPWRFLVVCDAKVSGEQIAAKITGAGYKTTVESDREV